MEQFFVGTDTSQRPTIHFQGDACSEGFPDLEDMLASTLAATTTNRLNAMDVNDITMRYSGGEFCIQIDNWCTSITALSNSETVLEDIQKVLTKSKKFVCINRPEQRSQ